MKAKTFDLCINVGKCRYVITYCTGERTYADGSLALDITICSNKKQVHEEVARLQALGYTGRCWI